MTGRDEGPTDRRSRPVVDGLTALFALIAALMCAALTGCADEGVRAAVASDVAPDRAGTVGFVELVRIETDMGALPARMFVADGDGPHPTLLLLHDRPDVELHLDLAHAVRRAGWNVLAPHDGAGAGVGGATDRSSLERGLGVARSSLRFLRAPATAARYRVDAGRLAVLGHGVGGAAALRSATSDTSLVAAGSMAGYVPAAPAARLADLASGLGHRPVLLLAASDDSVAPPARHHAPDVEALRRRGPWLLVHRVLDADHHFTARRIELATAVVAWLRTVDRTWVRSAKID